MQSESNYCIVCGDAADILISTHENALQLKEKMNKYLPIECEIYLYSLATQTKHEQQCCVDCVNTICYWDFFYKRCKEVQQQINNKNNAADTSQQLRVDEQCPDESIGLVIDNIENENYPPTDLVYDSDIGVNEQCLGESTRSGFVDIDNIENEDDPPIEPAYVSDIGVNEHYLGEPTAFVIYNIENEDCPSAKAVYERDIGVNEGVVQAPVIAHTTKIQNRFFKSRNRKICTFCKFNTATLQNLNQHLINEHWKLIFCCNICNSYLPRLQLIPHMTEHALKSKTVTIAAVPVVGTLNSPNSSSNQQEEVRTLYFECEKCNASFRSMSGIKYHMNAKHTQMKTFDCVICNYKFTSKRVLENHKRSLHGRDKRNYPCRVCGKAFKTDSNLYTHQKLHSTEKPFQCAQCNKTFRLKHHLTGHMVQHKDFTNKNSLPYECNCCHKKFAAMDNLRKHKKIHDQTLSDFICHICGAKMKQKRYLRQHMRKVHLQRLTAEV